jgi:hypothetical protein
MEVNGQCHGSQYESAGCETSRATVCLNAVDKTENCTVVGRTTITRSFIL